MTVQNVVRGMFAAVAVVSTVVVLKDHTKVVKKERAKREEIKLNTQRELLALARANLVVQKKVMHGDYSRNLATAVSDIQNDIKFYRIVDRIND